MGPLTTALPDPVTLTQLPGRTFVAPGRYVQGPGVLDQLGPLLAPRHHTVALLVDAPMVDIVGQRMRDSLAAAGIKHQLLPVTGEVTHAGIGALTEAARPGGSSVIVGAGGGKALDLAKGTAKALGLPMVSVPTIASNDGPTSRVVATYNEQHLLIETPHLSLNPELVLVDTEVLAAAPTRFLRSGIGDALAKYYEARACAAAGGRATTGQRPLQLAGLVAAGCRAVLEADALAALAASEAGRPDAAFERVAEAVLLLSGMAFENGGLSMAHAMTRGLMVTAGADRQLHGYHVAYGLLVQLAHEGDDESSDQVHDLLAATGLPVCLRDLDVQPDPAVIRALAQSVVDSPHTGNCAPRPSVESVTRAIEQVEARPAPRKREQ